MFPDETFIGNADDSKKTSSGAKYYQVKEHITYTHSISMFEPGDQLQIYRGIFSRLKKSFGVKLKIMLSGPPEGMKPKTDWSYVLYTDRKYDILLCTSVLWIF